MAEDRGARSPAQRHGEHGLALLGRDTLLYGGATVLARVLALVTFPVLTRVLATEEYGVLDALAVVGTVLSCLVTMGQDSALARFYYDTDDEEERRQAITQALLAQAALCLLLVPLLMLGANRMLELFIAAPEHGPLLRLLLLSFPATIFLGFCRNLLKWTFARRAFILLDLGTAALIAALTLAATVGLGLGLRGVYYAQLTGSAIAAALALRSIRGYLARPRGFHVGVRMLRFGWPYMAVGVVEALVPAVDRTFVATVRGLEAVGLYAVGYRIASLALVPVAAFQTAAGPFFLARYRDADAPETFDRVLALFAGCGGLVGFALVAAGPALLELLASNRYAAGAPAILPLTFAFLVRSTAWIASLGIGLSKRTVHHLAGYLIGLAATAAAVRLLVGPLGIAGAAWGVLAGTLVQGAYQTIAARRLYPLHFSFGRPLLLLALSLSLGALVTAVDPSGPAAAGLAGAAGAAVLTVAVWALALGPRERAALRELAGGAGASRRR